MPGAARRLRLEARHERQPLLKDSAGKSATYTVAKWKQSLIMENTFDQPNPARPSFTPEPFGDFLSFSAFHFATSLLSAPTSPVNASSSLSSSTGDEAAQIDVTTAVVAEKARDVLLDPKVKLAKLLDVVHDNLVTLKQRHERRLDGARRKEGRLAVKMVKLEVRIDKVLAKYRKLKDRRERLRGMREVTKDKFHHHQLALVDNLNMWTTCQDVAAGSGLFFPSYPSNALASF
ncbi:hypothetical protein JCM10049v2_001966 [Rhodotorula toruloides]